LALCFVVQTLGRKLHDNARWHRQILLGEMEALLLEHESRFADRLSSTFAASPKRGSPAGL
jgi:hypothetical protein